MGYRKTPIIYTLEFDGEHEGLVVRMKSMKIGVMRKIIRLIDSDDDNTGAVLDHMVEQVAKGLVSWNMEDYETGEPIPATLESVDELDYQVLKMILDKWLDLVTGPSEELGKDSPAGGSFPGQPLTMEAV